MNRDLEHISGTTINLGKNGKFQFAKRHALQIYRSNSIYSFIPKNACSTMRYSIARANGFIRDERDIHWIHNNNPTFGADLKSLIISDYTFVILRCPYRRLASAFLDKIVNLKPDAHEYYSNTHGKIDPLTLTFRQFVKSLNKRDIFKSNIHWKPQVDFLIYKNYDDYFAFENFEHLKKILREKINFKICDARNLTNHGIDKFNFIKEDQLNCDIPVIDIINMKKENKIVPPRTLYDNELFSMTEQLYSADIKFYVSKFGDKFLMKL